MFELADGGRYGADDAGDLAVEALGEIAHGDALLGFHALGIGGLLGAQLLGVAQRAQKLAGGAPEVADLVLAGIGLDRDIELAVGHGLHRVDDPADGTAQRDDADIEAGADADEKADDRRGEDDEAGPAADGVELLAQRIGHVAQPLDMFLQRGLQCLAVGAVGLVVALGVGRLRAFRGGEARGLCAERDEVGDILGDRAEARAHIGVIGRGDLLRGLLQLVEAALQAGDEGLGGFRVLRHVDAARVHDDGADQAVDAFGEEGLTMQLVELVGEAGFMRQRVDRNAADDRRCQA